MKILLLIILFANLSYSQSPVESILTEDAIKALRDPFHVPGVSVITASDKPKPDLESYPLKDIKLNGVITGEKKAKAMITLPNGKSFFVSMSDRIGVRDGHVISISGDSIKIIEYDRDEKGKKIPEIFQLSISGEMTSLTKKEER